MNIVPSRLSALLTEHSEKLAPNSPGLACLLEFKLTSKELDYVNYTQVLLLKKNGVMMALWRKFKQNSSLSHGDTLWENVEEYDPDFIKGTVAMLGERIEDLAAKARKPELSITMSLEMAKVITPENVSPTRDSKYSFVVKVSSKRMKRWQT